MSLQTAQDVLDLIKEDFFEEVNMFDVSSFT